MLAQAAPGKADCGTRKTGPVQAMVRIHIYEDIYIYICVCVCVCVCMHTYIYIYVSWKADCGAGKKGPI